MVEQDELKTGIGTKETVTLKPGVVKIEEVRVEELGTKKAKKIICMCRHPDATDLIQISAVRYENKGKLSVIGLWVNKDDDNLIRKGSALAVFLGYCNVKTPEELKDHEVQTAQDENGYLVFRGY